MFRAEHIVVPGEASLATRKVEECPVAEGKVLDCKDTWLGFVNYVLAPRALQQRCFST